MAKFILVVLSLFAFETANAKDSGLIFVGNEKTNNIIVIDAKTYKVVNDIKVSRRPRPIEGFLRRTNKLDTLGDDEPESQVRGSNPLIPAKAAIR
jgi:YVTN family beta-propeller protein